MPVCDKKTKTCYSVLWGTLHSRWITSRRVKVLAAWFDQFAPRGSHVLDVGCGDGLLERAEDAVDLTHVVVAQKTATGQLEICSPKDLAQRGFMLRASRVLILGCWDLP